MKHKILWAGLADDNYYQVIAKHCLPSWSKLPGDKIVVHDANSIDINEVDIIQWNQILPIHSNFLSKRKPSKKVWNFWRKMKSQVYIGREFKKKYNFIILLDTDIEILDNFSADKIDQELDKFIDSGLVWATGRSQSRLHDSGFIILNTAHELFDTVLNDYENIWEGEDFKISKLKKPYDGHAVESMFDQYPSYKIMNTDYGKGFHLYDLGLVHYGSKIPKKLRIDSNLTGSQLVAEYISDIEVKKYKY